MEDSQLVLSVAQGILMVGITIVGYFIRRLITNYDHLSRDILKLRERVIRLESKSENYNEKLAEVKTKLDDIDANIMWVREKVASLSG